MKNQIITLFAILCLVSTINAQDDLLIRHPAVSPDGQSLAFSWQGDIWTANIDGKNARRITIHESYEIRPTWSPDGQTIIFEGQRYGNMDLFAISKSGQNLRRLTHHSAGDGVASMDEKGNVYFSSRRTFAAVERASELHKTNLKGETPHRVMDATALSSVISPNGKYVAWVRGTCRAEREAYTGPANRNIWLYNLETKKYTALANNDWQENMPKWAGNDQLFYLNAQNGKYNIYSLKPADGENAKPKAITNYKRQGIRYFSVSADGKTFAFTQGGNLMVVKAGGKAKKIKISVPNDERFDPIAHKTYRGDIREYAISPNGKLAAFVIRGEVFVGEAAKDKSKAVNISKHAYNDKDIQWLNDSTLIFISDRDGNYNIYMARSTDSDEKSLLKTFKREVVQVTTTPENERNLVMSPDGQKLAYIKGDGDLIIQNIDTLGQFSTKKTLVSGWNAPRSLSWSPDAAYLAYSRTNLDFNSEIYIQAVDGKSEPVNVSMHPRGDYSPVWSPDGSKLGFTSIRNNGNSDVWFAWLKKSDWEKTRADWEESDDDGGKKKKGKKGKKVPKVEIDFDGLHERLEQVTYLPGNEFGVKISPDGETFYFSTNGGSRAGYEGASDFKKVKWNGEKMETIFPKTYVGGLSLSSDKKSFYFLKRGRINKMPVKGKKATGFSYVAKMDINHKQEMEQIFEEAWRIINDGFYDPNFHGKDWNKLRDQYKPIALSASTIQDFREIYNELLGQLNASHMGLRGSSTPESLQRERTGILGTELLQVANGVKITKVIPNTPADRTASQLNVGDIITAVNGETTVNQNFHTLMLGTTNERVMLNITAANGENREVIIRPTYSIRGQLYEMWVKERKAMTEKYSNGKLGYIHIQGMNWNSFERFERELTASGLGKKGIVIDVRYNGGGWTTDMLMAVLNVKQHSYTVPRGAVKSLEKENKKYKEHYPYGERLPLASWTKPAITLCNQNSYSNAEIFSHAFKTLDRGTLVGMPTFGAVISTGGGGLIDGSYIRRPFRAWYVKATGENMEHGPAVPDVLLENAPDYRTGKDAQLEKAVELLLKESK